MRDVLRQAGARISCVRVCVRALLCASASFTAPSDQAGLCICFHQSPVRAGVSAFSLSVAFVRVCAFLCRESLFVCARAIVCWRLPLSAGNGAQGLAHGSLPGGAGRRVQASACPLADCTRIRVGGAAPFGAARRRRRSRTRSRWRPRRQRQPEYARMTAYGRRVEGAGNLRGEHGIAACVPAYACRRVGFARRMCVYACMHIGIRMNVCMCTRIWVCICSRVRLYRAIYYV